MTEQEKSDWESLVRITTYGLDKDKRTVIARLDVLQAAATEITRLEAINAEIMNALEALSERWIESESRGECREYRQARAAIAKAKALARALPRKPLKDWTIEELRQRYNELQKIMMDDPSKEDEHWEEYEFIWLEICAHNISA